MYERPHTRAELEIQLQDLSWEVVSDYIDDIEIDVLEVLEGIEELKALPRIKMSDLSDIIERLEDLAKKVY